MLAAAAAPEGAGRIAVGGGGCGDAQENRQAGGGCVEEARLFQCRYRGISARRIGESLFYRNERANSGGASGHRNDYRRGSGEIANSSGGRRKTYRRSGADRISWSRH